MEAEASAKTKSECGALVCSIVVNGHISHPRYRLRPLPAIPLVVCRRYLIVVPRPLPTAPLVVRRRFLTVAPRLLPAAPLVVFPRYLIVVPRSLPAAPLVVCRRYLTVVARPLPAAPRRCRSRRRTTLKMYSGAE